MTQPNPFFEDFREEIFGEQPELAFLGQLGQQNLPRNLEDFFRSRTNDFVQRFRQAQAQQLAQGQLPTLRPDVFFGGINFQNELARFSPQARGMGTSQFAPRVRYL